MPGLHSTRRRIPYGETERRERAKQQASWDAMKAQIEKRYSK